MDLPEDAATGIPQQDERIADCGISSPHSLHLIGCPQGTNIIATVVQQGYAGGVQKDHVVFGACREMKLNGYPWGNGHSSELMRRGDT